MTIVDVPVALTQVNVLIESSVVIVDARGKIIHRRGLEGVGRSRQGDENGIAAQVALSIVIKEEKYFVLDHRTADVAAELIEVVSGLERKRPSGVLGEGALQAVNRIVCVQAAIAEELECSSVKGIGSRFGNHVDHRSASAPEFCGIAVGVDLEFLHRILAELIGSSSRTRTSERLSEESVVVVCAVHGE